MRSLFTIVILQLLLLTGMAFGQEIKERPERKALLLSEAKRYQAMMRREVTEVASDDRYDAISYLLDIRVQGSPWIGGRVDMTARIAQNNVNAITLDLMSGMTIDSVRVDGVRADIVRSYANYDVILHRPYNSGEYIDVETFYHGVPGSSGFGSFVYTYHSYGGQYYPWIYTLSEPYGAKDWWPCKDHPSDKADSVDMYVTVAKPFLAGSNGTLISAHDNPDNTTTYHWHEQYPIATYLVSLAISNFSQYTDWFHYSSSDSMPILNYVLPEHLTLAKNNLWRVPAMLGIYSNLFGLYPFVNEKYGHSEFGWGGAEEHQTMTSTTVFDEWTICHELSHQWFGDMITCRSWHDLWLNEGFATYCEALYAEKAHGTGSYWEQINDDMTHAKGAVGSVYLTDTSDVNTMFASNLVYSKGGIVLHMLRHVMGDSAFFHAMYAYAHTQGLRFASALTEDFRSVCESSSGMDLRYFFDEWVYGENYPVYSYACSMKPDAQGYRININLRQRTYTTNPACFTMPIDFKFSADGWDTTITMMNTATTQTLSAVVSHVPTSVDLDPEGWILKTVIPPAYTAFAPSVDTVDVGDVNIAGTRTRTVTILNFGSSRMVIASATSDSPEFVITPGSAYIPVGGSKDFSVTVHPAALGLRTGNLLFLLSGTTVPNVVPVISNALTSTALLAPSVDTLGFDSVRIGDVRTLTLTVGNSGTIPLVIASVISDLSVFTVSPTGGVTIPVGGSAPFSIQFAPVSGDLYAGAIKFTHNGTNSPSVVYVNGAGERWNAAMHVQSGWNLVSLPYTVADPQRTIIFPGATSTLFAYVPPGSYEPRTSLIGGNGYWLKFPAGQDVSIAGASQLVDSVVVSSGWNLIGSLSVPLSIGAIGSVPPAMVTSNIYGYSGGYRTADTLQPCRGYWIKVQENGMLILSAGAGMPASQRIRISGTDK